MTSPDRCQSSSSSSPSPQRRRLSSKSSDRGSLWKLDATMDVKHRPFKPARHDSSPSSSPSSSSSSMAPFIRKDLKSPPPLKCSKLSPESQIHKSPPRASSGTLGGCFSGDGWDERHRMTNGTASPSQTAQILFSLGTSAYQRGVDADRREKLTGRTAGKTGSPHRPSLHPPTLHLPPPLPPPPPPPSEGLTAPPHSSSYPPSDSMKPELICGVCHRLFSSASSLTVHMRLHRGSRALSCRYCGKAFIHSKRLQSHEASCRMPGLAGDAAASELLAGDENHFVKVVDGNVIYFCSVCERSYMTLSSLKRHSNVHSWRRKYPCHYCDKVFALAEYRTKHEVWHTGERRYQCIFCWDAFATYYNLKTHQKTIHGINPSLISSEKTANGGYKQRANALKLYRLLPMRSQKRPYKTYSDSLHNGLLLPPADTPSLSLPGLGCALGPGDLMPSVITYGHTKPSVIVHGAAVSSSVIVHSNQVTSGSEKSPVTSPSPETSSNTETGKAFHKSRKSHNKGAISKVISASGGSQAKESGPLCQITVRIGEEAIVKRSISETDLKRDKSLSPPKIKRSETSSVKEPHDEEDQEEMEEQEQDSDNDIEDNLWRPYYSYKPKKKAQAHLQRVKNWQRKLKRPWTNGNAAECGTCGRWFSSPRKRDKHELKGQLGLGGSSFSPSRLSRRALSRHTCPQCHKVCKTSSALSRHMRRHDLSSSPEREKEDNNLEATPSKAIAEPLCTDPGTDKGQTPNSLSVSVINYSPAELPSNETSEDPELTQPGDTTPADYPAQDYPLPLIVPDIPDRGDLGKLPFYPDPYQLLYGPQLLAYPYNLAALPVTLNMMAPGGDKVEPLPFLPTIFNYAATAGPYMGAAPHPLVANPGLYRSSGSGKKQRDGSGSKQ
uniref:Zinc finger and BTB domain containing 4 n=1 Tax=Cyprinodon variegatus TaxID=28743 RepID=A0A3Q2CFQ0_CYPVA